jgi:two-component system, chemotaxis family, protein-glutamate methylesterase/glutaminase
MKKIKVLVVDDSAVVRKLITDTLASSGHIEVVGTAMDPYIAADKIKNLQPDVITLDIEMPRMDGITFLDKLMKVKPMPVIMVSSFTDKGATETIRALECGAADFILKPAPDESSEKWKEFSRQLVDKIEAVSLMHVKRHIVKTANPVVKSAQSGEKTPSTFVIAIGASTGGTEVISDILSALPERMPGIVVTQHMPPKFTEAFANRINTLSVLTIREAAHGDRIYDGHAYIAPGGTQMLVRGDSGGYWIEVNDDPPQNRHKPSVNVLFNSVANCAGENSLGVILTGMGNDGAAGLLEMRNNGAVTIAQDEASCIVFGMPREAIRMGGAQEVKNVEQIIGYLRKAFNEA